MDEDVNGISIGYARPKIRSLHITPLHIRKLIIIFHECTHPLLRLIDEIGSSFRQIISSQKHGHLNVPYGGTTRLCMGNSCKFE